MKTVFLVTDEAKPFWHLAERIRKIEGVIKVEIFSTKIVHSIIPSPDLVVVFVDGIISHTLNEDILFGMILRMIIPEIIIPETITPTTEVVWGSGSGWAACRNPSDGIFSNNSTGWGK